MNDFERQIRELISQWSAKISDWWSHSSIKSALARLAGPATVGAGRGRGADLHARARLGN